MSSDVNTPIEIPLQSCGHVCKLRSVELTDEFMLSDLANGFAARKLCLSLRASQRGVIVNLLQAR